MQSRVMVMLAGAGLGLAGGYLTRPSFMGMQVPVKVLFSSNPLDAPFRSDMAIHLGIATVIGLVVATVLHMALSRTKS